MCAHFLYFCICMCLCTSTCRLPAVSVELTIPVWSKCFSRMVRSLTVLGHQGNVPMLLLDEA